MTERGLKMVENERTKGMQYRSNWNPGKEGRSGAGKREDKESFPSRGNSRPGRVAEWQEFGLPVPCYVFESISRGNFHR
jgi:hypothetical protein